MRNQIEIIKECPSCESELVLENGVLYCRNKACPAILQRSLKHFIKTLGIKGLGDQTLEKLNLQSIEEIFNLTREGLEETLGSNLVATKLIEQINHAKNAPLDKVIASFGIPLVGVHTVSKLTSHISSVDEITTQKCKEAGLGDKATANLIKFLEEQFPYYRDKLPFNYTVKQCKNDHKEEICITGKLNSFKTKEEAKIALEEIGFMVVDSVRKTTKYLVDENSSNSEKRKKAEMLNIAIIDNLNNFIGI